MSSQSSTALPSVGETLGALYVGVTIAAVYVSFHTCLTVFSFIPLVVYMEQQTYKVSYTTGDTPMIGGFTAIL